MTARTIGPTRLIRDTLNRTPAVYLPLLILSSPALLLTLIRLLVASDAIVGLINLAYAVLVTPWLTGAVIFFTDRHLSQQPVSLEAAIKHGLDRYGPLILGLILVALLLIPGFIFLVIPGIYLSVKLAFTLYAIALENETALGGLERSWQLTKGHWWSIFGSLLLATLAFGVPALLIMALTIPAFGATSAVSRLVSAVLGVLISPFFSVFLVLLYRRLRALFEPVDAASAQSIDE